MELASPKGKIMGFLKGESVLVQRDEQHGEGMTHRGFPIEMNGCWERLQRGNDSLVARMALPRQSQRTVKSDFDGGNGQAMELFSKGESGAIRGNRVARARPGTDSVESFETFHGNDYNGFPFFSS